MRSFRSVPLVAHRVAVAAVMLCLGGMAGCATVPSLPIRADRYRLELTLNPARHTLVGSATMDIVRTDEAPVPSNEPVAIELLLHPDLRIRSVTLNGAALTGRHFRVTKRTKFAGTKEFTPTTHRLVLDHPIDSGTLRVAFEGVLQQDVAAGEIPGEIHNFQMRAHIGEKGIFLADGYWYPQPVMDDAGAVLSDYTVVATSVPGMELVAAGEQDPALSDQTGRLAWRTPYPISEMVLVGGPHEVHRSSYLGVSLSLHLKPDQRVQVEGLFSALRRNLDRYEPLIGPYPAREFAIVDNFFSSGFAFPTFTLLSSMVIDMGHRSQTAHGYLDHELLHSWWGNGVFVDPRDGNWCEALASYGANYYGYVLDGNPDEARRKRRNYCHFLSRLKPEADKPLGTYGLENGCGRGIAYNKGAMFFHMLARRIGQDTFWGAMRRFTDGYVGRLATWDDIRRLCERQSGQSLDSFFQQWVRRGGAPRITLDSARYNASSRTLTLTVRQSEPAFELDLPVRVSSVSGTRDMVVPLEAGPTAVISVPIDYAPRAVELDPDYHVFRKVPVDDIIPTTATTRRSDAIAVVTAAGDIAPAYRSIRDIFVSGFDAHKVTHHEAGRIPEGALATRSVLILGPAVRDAYVAGFLSAIEFPVRWLEDGFVFDAVEYTDPGDAILCTIAHPGARKSGVTIIFANSEAAIPKPRNIPMYDRSVIIFKNQKPVVRRDFERAHVVPVERS